MGLVAPWHVRSFWTRDWNLVSCIGRQITEPFEFFFYLPLLLLSRSVMSDSVRPHGLQPSRLLCPWDSPGKSTGVGCHFLLHCMKMKVKLLSRVQLCATPWTAAHQAPPSMVFSRQEHWSGVPLPSPMQVFYLFIWKEEVHGWQNRKKEKLTSIELVLINSKYLLAFKLNIVF